MPSAEDVFGTMAGAALSPLVSAASLLLRRRCAKGDCGGQLREHSLADKGCEREDRVRPPRLLIAWSTSRVAAKLKRTRLSECGPAAFEVVASYRHCVHCGSDTQRQ